MKHLLTGLLAASLALGALPVRAQQKPNFSADWKINQLKSNFGDVPAPDAFTRKIVHAEPTISIDEVQSSPAGEQATQRKMTTDGKESTFTTSGAEIKATAKWEGNALVIVSNVPAIGIAYNDRMTLSPDGKLLTSVVRLDTAQGAFELTVVFDKQ